MTADLALTMLSVVDAAGPTWRIRIGIHNGPVVAGVIGTSKFFNDLWGDAVNVASRLEASSKPGRWRTENDLEEVALVSASNSRIVRVRIARGPRLRTTPVSLDGRGRPATLRESS